MNLLAKDKYRTKIMQHILSDYAGKQHQNEEVTNENINSINEAKKIQTSDENMPVNKVLNKIKRKALICDQEETEANLNAKQSSTSLHSVQGKKSKGHVRQALKSFNHLHKEQYTYHQKLPIISVSSSSDPQFMNKFRKNPTIIPGNKNENKQNKHEESNQLPHSQKKNKIYRFIHPEKVAEALRNKMPRQNDHKMSMNQQTFLPDFDSKCENFVRFEENKIESEMIVDTQRSKESAEMMNYLQSARQKLFENINRLKEIELSHRDQNEQRKRQSQLWATQDQQNNGQKHFKIEIEVSPRKTCQLTLTLSCDPRSIAHSFLSQNKQVLGIFNDFQLRKLEQLLSTKISLQIQNQRRKSASKERQQKNNKIQKQQGTQFVVPFNPPGREVTKPLQFSHIYIESIDPQMTHHQEQDQSLDGQRDNQGRCFQTQRLIEESPKKNKIILPGLQHQKEQQIEQNTEIYLPSLKGYTNSPHELITYAPELNQIHQHDKQIYRKNLLEKKLQQGLVEISHFPLCSSLNNFSQQNISKQETERIEIGASKIFSKSRLKGFDKKNRQNPINCESNIELQPFAQQIQNEYRDGNKEPEQSAPLPTQKIDTALPATITVRSMNSISQQIISRVGKQNILQAVKEKQLSKRENILKQKQAKQLDELRECSFQPKINNVSKQIDMNRIKKIKIGDLVEKDSQNTNFTLPSRKQQVDCGKMQSAQFETILSKLQNPGQQSKRYHQLYSDYKRTQARKQWMRRKSIEEIPFKPEINKISNRIIETKRHSLSNSTCQDSYSLTHSKMTQSRHHSTCKNTHNKRDSLYVSRKICDNYYSRQNEDDQEWSAVHQKKRKSLNLSRNLEGLEIGEYLYKEAMRLKKKKQSMSRQPGESFKPLPKSEQLVQKAKEKKLSECFYELLNVQRQQSEPEYEFLLKPQCINLEQSKFTNSHLKFLVPLLQELQQLDVSLTEHEFIQAGLKLLASLTQDQKGQFLGKKCLDQPMDESKESQQILLKKVSEELVQKKQYFLHDIYHRSLAYKKRVKETIELSMEEKVRKQLQKCTFKPKINSTHLAAS